MAISNLSGCLYLITTSRKCCAASKLGLDPRQMSVIIAHLQRQFGEQTFPSLLCW
jgi:hypothetical protein